MPVIRKCNGGYAVQATILPLYLSNNNSASCQLHRLRDRRLNQAVKPLRKYRIRGAGGLQCAAGNMEDCPRGGCPALMSGANESQFCLLSPSLLPHTERQPFRFTVSKHDGYFAIGAICGDLLYDGSPVIQIFLTGIGVQVL
jgi:hypothetical protein